MPFNISIHQVAVHATEIHPAEALHPSEPGSSGGSDRTFSPMSTRGREPLPSSSSGLPFDSTPMKSTMQDITLPNASDHYAIHTTPGEHGLHALYRRDPDTDAPIHTGKYVRSDKHGGWELVPGAKKEQQAPVLPPSAKISADPLRSSKDGADSPPPTSNHASATGLPDVAAGHEPPSAADGAREPVDVMTQARKLVESKGLSFPDPPFLRENRQYQELRDNAYKTVAACIEGGDKMHHVTQVFHELRDVLGKNRDAHHVRDAESDGLYKLDIGGSQFLLQKDWRNPVGLTRKEFAFPTEWSMPWLKWKGWKEIPSKYQNYFNLVEGRRAEFEKQIKTYAKNPPRSYNDIVEFRARRQKELDDYKKIYVEDKRQRRQQYVWRRHAVATAVAVTGGVAAAVYSLERIFAMATGSSSGSSNSTSTASQSHSASYAQDKPFS